MKKAICLLFAVLMVLSLTGCNPTQTFAHLEMTMQVPEGMQNVTVDDDMAESHIVFALEKGDFLIAGVRQEISTIENGLSMTPTDYANLIVQEKGLIGRATVGERKSKGYVYLRFSWPHENGINEYFCGVYKTSTAFWFLQMNGLTEGFDEGKWFSYLDSVTFSQ